MGKSIYRYYSRTIAAGAVAKINVFGRFLTLLSNSSTTSIKVSIASQGEEDLPAGLSVELPETDNFTILEFRNPTAGPVTIAFSVSAGRIFDNRFVVSDAILVNNTSDTIETPAAISVPTTAPGAPQIAADTTRREAIIQNNGANPLWAGDSAVDGANNRGTLIAVGATVFLNTTAAIYLRATGGSTTASPAYLKRV